MSSLLQEVLFDGAEYWYTLFYAERTAAAHSDCDRRIRGRAQFRSQGREGCSRRARGSPRYGPVRGGDAPDVPPDARRLPVDDLPHAPPLEMDVRGERQAQYGGEARQGNCPVERLLERLLREWKPDAVVCTYMVYPYMLDSLASRTGRAVPYLTVVTDSFVINKSWLCSKSPSGP